MQQIRRQFFALLSLAVLFLAIGCAPTSRFPTVDNNLAASEARNQRLEAMRSEFQQSQRLYETSFQVYASNTEFCGKNVGYRMGFKAPSLAQFPNEWRDLAGSEYGIGDQLTVLYVIDNSPAEQAGMRPRDKIVAINGMKIGTGKRASRKMVNVISKHKGGEITVTVQRGDQEHNIVAMPKLLCNYPIQLVNNDQVNAWVDGTNTYITSGMMRVLENQDELALVVGHELAHITRNHIAAKRGNVLIGALIGAAISSVAGVNVTDIGAQAGAAAFSQEFEAEADYVGVYHAARAGFDTSNAAALWRRLGTMHPQSIHLAGSTHPSTAKRFLAVEMAAREVEQKRREGLPLIPDERKDAQ